MARLSTRIANLERSAGCTDASDTLLLVSLLGRRDALFWPWRHLGHSRLGIQQRQREYLTGLAGLSSKADGKHEWKSMHEARQRLIQAGMVDALRSGGQVTSLFITPLGEATARALVGSRLRTLREVLIVYVSLDETWTSESVLFSRDCSGSPTDWDDWTELVLPLLVAGLVESRSDTHGRVGYRRTSKELPSDSPKVDVQFDETMDSIYVKAFNAERDTLQNCEPLDTTEAFCPLPMAALKNYEPS